jgi:hypothetical protein
MMIAGEDAPLRGGSRPPPELVSSEAICAAFTVNLTRFITWPEGTFASPTAPIVIGTFPRDPINDALDAAVRGEVVEGRPLQAIRIHSLGDFARCQAVYLSKNNVTRPAVLAQLRHKPILTVSDAEGFLELGGHVRFDTRPGRPRLRISQQNLKASDLAARAQLLRLAAMP